MDKNFARFGRDIKNYVLEFYQEMLFRDVLDEIRSGYRRDSYYVQNGYTYLYKRHISSVHMQNIYITTMNRMNRQNDWDTIIKIREPSH